MEKETKVADDFLAGLDKELDLEEPIEEDLFPEETKEEVKEEVKEEQEEEKPLPFYKDPKVQRYIEKQLDKRLKETRPTATETFKQEVSAGDPDLVNAFTAIIGNDTPEKQAALKALETSLSKVDERATQKAIERLQQVQKEKAEREVQEIAEAEDEIEEGFEDIEAHYGINLNDKQKEAYKNFLIKIEPKGGYVEYPDFIETFEIFKNNMKANRPSNAQAKVLAARGMQQSSTAASTGESFVQTNGNESLWQKFAKMKNQINN